MVAEATRAKELEELRETKRKEGVIAFGREKTEWRHGAGGTTLV